MFLVISSVILILGLHVIEDNPCKKDCGQKEYLVIENKCWCFNSEEEQEHQD